MSGKIIKVSRNTENAPINRSSTQSVAFSHYNNISAQLPIVPSSGKLVEGGIREHSRQCLDNIKAIVESVGHGLHDVVKITVYLKSMADLDAVDEVYNEYFSSHLPTRSVLAVAALPTEGALVQMDALISNGEGTHPQAPCELIKRVRNTPKAPMDRLSSQSVAFSHYNHISAQLPIEPNTGNIAAGGVKAQARQCLTNLKAVLTSIDVPLDDIVKINIHVTNLDDICAVNEVYSSFFPCSAIARSVAYMPARSIIKAEGLPMDALVQIDATVSHGDGTPPQAVEDRHGIVIRAHNTENAPVSKLATHTVAFSHYNNVSAQLPIQPQSGDLIASDVRQQTAQCLSNIKAIVESVNHDMDDIVKFNIQLKQVEDLAQVDQVLADYFDNDYPSRTVIGVSDIAMGALVQIDAIVSNAEGTPPQA
ncbi:RidA family protein [Vibrio hippocampi]|uniref:Aminoacrylate peracid reductase RutC n=1 Tax=Vibrio hippocampi TaxID=654686 RepID=A0ABN8DI14_9VIBR|nr:RidA family protein [Vibrio hippocampi]CAH0526201.1 Putative aminoacrylate peracid reductase RutC [Vibrio hippocampi]